MIFQLTDVDGNVRLLGPTAFLAFLDTNDFLPATVDDIENLDVGEVFADGGGAAPAWQIERIR